MQGRIPGFGKPGASFMLYQLSRLMQFAGLIILPVAISGNVAEKLDLKQSLILSSIGVLVFFGGWLLQQTSRPQ
ncbi:MAG: hypothetical protein L0Y70_13140 [Gemmataceae bacterium]|nr:hypothetical protein [Gemmataceae bacterium]